MKRAQVGAARLFLGRKPTKPSIDRFYNHEVLEFVNCNTKRKTWVNKTISGVPFSNAGKVLTCTREFSRFFHYYSHGTQENSGEFKGLSRTHLESVRSGLLAELCKALDGIFMLIITVLSGRFETTRLVLLESMSTIAMGAFQLDTQLKSNSSSQYLQAQNAYIMFTVTSKFRQKQTLALRRFPPDG